MRLVLLGSFGECSSARLDCCTANPFLDMELLDVSLGHQKNTIISFVGARKVPNIMTGRFSGGSWIEGRMAPFERHWPVRTIEDKGMEVVRATMSCDMGRPAGSLQA